MTSPKTDIYASTKASTEVLRREIGGPETTFTIFESS